MPIISDPRRAAELAVRIKEQYRKILNVTSGYGPDNVFTTEIEILGRLIKELEDTVILTILHEGPAECLEPALKRRAHSG